MRRAALVASACLVTLAAACGHDLAADTPAVLDALPRPDTTTTVAPSSGDAQPTTTTTSPTQGACDDDHLATASHRPDERALAGDAPDVVAIRERGVLRVGVDENTLGFSSRNPGSGEIEGFEVDLARVIAARIFGDENAGRVDPVPVVTDEKLPFVEEGIVDMTISANSMTCARWERVAFSTEYYTAHQKFLVREDSPIRSMADLAGKTVCVTTKSSSFDLLDRYVPEAKLEEVADRTGCLLALQEGEVDAYFGHDSFLYGMRQADPTLVIREANLPPYLSVSHYGIAIELDKPDLVRFVNAVLEDIRQDGTWQALHERWLEDQLSMPPAAPPPPRYRDRRR
jgi:polar amino acid transport system substrate-binding protein